MRTRGRASLSGVPRVSLGTRKEPTTTNKQQPTTNNKQQPTNNHEQRISRSQGLPGNARIEALPRVRSIYRYIQTRGRASLSGVPRETLGTREYY